MAKDAKGHGSEKRGGYERGVSYGNGSTTKNFFSGAEKRERDAALAKLKAEGARDAAKRGKAKPKGADHSRDVGRKVAERGGSLKSAMKSAGVKPGTKTAQAMLAGYHAAKSKAKK